MSFDTIFAIAYQVLDLVPSYPLVWLFLTIVVVKTIVLPHLEKKGKEASDKAADAWAEAVPVKTVTESVKPAKSEKPSQKVAKAEKKVSKVKAEETKPVELNDEFDWSIYDAPAYTRRVAR